MSTPPFMAAKLYIKIKGDNSSLIDQTAVRVKTLMAELGCQWRGPVALRKKRRLINNKLQGFNKERSVQFAVTHIPDNEVFVEALAALAIPNNIHVSYRQWCSNW